MSKSAPPPLTPFRPEVGRPLIVHCSHHKVGTVWFRRVLGTLATAYDLRIERCVGKPVDPRTDIAFFRAGRHYRREDLPGRVFRGSHMIRDPRDVVVSGYFYHLWTDEEWAHLPGGPAWGGLSYHDFLNSVDRDRGLLAEIERSAASNLADMAAWDYGQPEFLELRYEDVIDDELSWFSRVFEFYGLDDEAVRVGLDAVARFSIRSQPSTPAPGNQRQHVRSGRTGQWRGEFGRDHVEAFKALTGDLLVKLGYESGQDWSCEPPDVDATSG